MNKNLPIIVSLMIGIVVGYAGNFLVSNIAFKEHVKEAIFTECFNYYAEINKEKGISKETISTCVIKTNDWLNEIEPM